MQQIRQIFTYTSGLRKFVIAVGALSVISALLAFARPYIIKLATDWVVAITTHATTFNWLMLWQLGGMLAAVAILGVLINDVNGLLGDQVSVRVRHQLSTAYYKHLLRLPQHYYDNEVSGKIVNRLSRAITDITNFLQFFSNNLLQMLLTTMLTIGVLLVYSWPLALLFAILIPANLYLTARTSGKWQAMEQQKNGHFDRASGRFTEVVGQIRLVKSFTAEKRELEYFDSEVGQMVGITRTQSRHWHTMNVLRGLVFGIINTLILAVIFYEAARGKITIGDLAMLVALVQQAAFPLNGLSFFVDSYQKAVANSKDFIAAMQEPAEPRDRSKKPLRVMQPTVEFKDVSFGYKDGAEVLHGVSFNIPAGSKLALVGESGAGKSTISNLLMALYNPTAGTVRVSGQDIAGIKKIDLRKSISTVFQDAALFSGTVRENIAYGKPGADDTEIMRAAKAANIDDFINKLPKGLDTEIGERGIKLSGGQKQRLAIARAMLKDAPILILDEATSSLDSKAEHEVQLALDRLMKNRTTLIIAHRLSTIAAVDTIVTLRNGKVDEIGSPHHLATSGGIYSELLELQTASTELGKKRLAQYDISA